MFITLEGSDGSGKTTQAALLIQFLQQQHLQVLHTREPGGTPIGDQIREVLHRLDNTAMHPHAEVLLYAASRAQIVNQVIRPHLAAGDVVICDRYADSTLAYQGYGHGLDLVALQQIMGFATGGLKPDLTLFFDISPDDALHRRQQAAAAGDEFNRMDNHQMDFYRRVYHGYGELIAAEPERWVRIDARQTIEAVQAQICEVVSHRLKI